LPMVNCRVFAVAYWFTDRPSVKGGMPDKEWPTGDCRRYTLSYYLYQWYKLMPDG